MSVFNPESPAGKIKLNRLYLLLFLSLIALIVGITFLAAVPPVSRDALTHHLFVPKLYLEHGGIYQIPSIPFSYYPMNLDLLYMIPLYFGNDIIPKYIHFLFALLTTWLIYDYLKNRTSSIYALLGSLFFLSIPIIVKLSITVYVDLGLMFFTTASLLLLFKWLNSGHKIRYLVFAGICCGLATGIKYNGLIVLFLLPLFIPVLYIRSKNGTEGSNSKGIGSSLIFLLAALITFSPWLIRNYAWTGNPIYPLHDSLFQQTTDKTVGQEQSAPQKEPAAIVKKLASRGSGVFATRKVLYHETWWQALLLPVRFFFAGQDDNPRYFDGRLNPFLLLLPFFAFTRKSPTRSLQIEKYTLLAFAGLFFFFTFFQEALRIRYIVCIVPPLVLLAIFGLHNIFLTAAAITSAGVRRGVQGLILLIPCAMLTYNTHYIIGQFQTIQPLSYILGTVDREEYITRFRPEYPVIQYANNQLQSDNQVLCIFLGNRGYYMDFKPVFDRPGQGGFLLDILQPPAHGKTIKNELLRRNISHILLREDLTQSWLQRLSVNKRVMIINFFRQETKKLFSSGGYSFFRITERNEMVYTPASTSTLPWVIKSMDTDNRKTEKLCDTGCPDDFFSIKKWAESYPE